MSEVLLLLTGATRKEVFCTLKSIGASEFYQAQATDLKPELKFVLEDFLDYDGEVHVEHEGTLYRVIRTYRAGLQLELTVTRASAEEVELYGQA